MQSKSGGAPERSAPVPERSSTAPRGSHSTPGHKYIDGGLALRLETHWREGATHILMERHELLDRAACPVPRTATSSQSWMRLVERPRRAGRRPQVSPVSGAMIPSGSSIRGCRKMTASRSLPAPPPALCVPRWSESDPAGKLRAAKPSAAPSPRLSAAARSPRPFEITPQRGHFPPHRSSCQNCWLVIGRDRFPASPTSAVQGSFYWFFRYLRVRVGTTF